MSTELNNINKEKKEDKTKNKSIVFIIAFVIASLAAIIIYGTYAKASSDSKVYNVDGAEFYIDLQENGDTLVTEHWEVSYLIGDFSRFYKDIHTKVTKLEKFDNIAVTDVYINGNKCDFTTNTVDRNDYTYSITDKGEDTEIAWYYHVNGETVTYDIFYTLENVVKKTEKDKAQFCYRIIGEDFKKNIDHIYLQITTPSNSSDGMELRFISNDGIWKTDINEIGLIAETVVPSSGMIKVNIATPLNQFGTLKDVKFTIFSKIWDKIYSIVTHPVVIIFLIIIIVSCFDSIKTGLRNKRMERLYAANPYRIHESISILRQCNEIPLLASALISIKAVGKIVRKSDLNTILNYLEYKGLANVTQNFIKINCAVSQDKYLGSIVKFLGENTKNRVIDGDMFINYEDLDVLNAKDTGIALRNIIESLREKLIAENRKNKKVVEEAYFINWYAKYKISVNDAANMNITHGGTIDYDNIVINSVLNVTGHVFFENNAYDRIGYVQNTTLSDILDDISESVGHYYSSSSGSSSGSGCSSCSSCGGCGGGGAD